MAENPDEPRKLVIRRSTETYIVDESKFDTVVVFGKESPDEGKTYKQAGFQIIAMIVDGSEVPYVARKRGEEVPGRQEVAAEQVAVLTEADQPVPAVVMRAADLDPVAPAEAVPAADREPATESTGRKPRTS